MTDETLTPIATSPTLSVKPIGRQADILAALIAAMGAVFSVLGALWFFAGFAENDTRPEHLASALALTLVLFTFAIVPFALTADFARRAYRQGTKRAHLFWTLFLMLPWVALGTLAVSHTPLPIWCGLIMAVLAAFLCLWALVSLILERKNPTLAKGSNTDTDTEL